MAQRERDRLIEICREIDSLVTEDPNCSNWEKLEELRQEMNGFIMNDQLQLAEDHAYKIYLVWSGQDPDDLFF